MVFRLAPNSGVAISPRIVAWRYGRMIYPKYHPTSTSSECDTDNTSTTMQIQTRAVNIGVHDSVNKENNRGCYFGYWKHESAIKGIMQ